MNKNKLKKSKDLTLMGHYTALFRRWNFVEPQILLVQNLNMSNVSKNV